MNELELITIPGMSFADIERVSKIESMCGTEVLERMRECQINIPVRHTLHGGIYARSVTIPAGVLITGALIKIPTLLIVNGECAIWIGEKFLIVSGYKVCSAGAYRKQLIFAKQSTDLTMCFPTQAKTVREAEEQFTDEAHLLQTHEA